MISTLKTLNYSFLASLESELLSGGHESLAEFVAGSKPSLPQSEKFKKMMSANLEDLEHWLQRPLPNRFLARRFSPNEFFAENSMSADDTSRFMPSPAVAVIHLLERMLFNVLTLQTNFVRTNPDTIAALRKSLASLGAIRKRPAKVKQFSDLAPIFTVPLTTLELDSDFTIRPECIAFPRSVRSLSGKQSDLNRSARWYLYFYDRKFFPNLFKGKTFPNGLTAEDFPNRSIRVIFEDSSFVCVAAFQRAVDVEVRDHFFMINAVWSFALRAASVSVITSRNSKIAYSPLQLAKLHREAGSELAFDGQALDSAGVVFIDQSRSSAYHYDVHNLAIGPFQSRLKFSASLDDLNESHQFSYFVRKMLESSVTRRQLYEPLAVAFCCPSVMPLDFYWVVSTLAIFSPEGTQQALKPGEDLYVAIQDEVPVFLTKYSSHVRLKDCFGSNWHYGNAGMLNFSVDSAIASANPVRTVNKSTRPIDRQLRREYVAVTAGYTDRSAVLRKYICKHYSLSQNFISGWNDLIRSRYKQLTGNYTDEDFLFLFPFMWSPGQAWSNYWYDEWMKAGLMQTDSPVLTEYLRQKGSEGYSHPDRVFDDACPAIRKEAIELHMDLVQMETIILRMYARNLRLFMAPVPALTARFDLTPDKFSSDEKLVGRELDPMGPGSADANLADTDTHPYADVIGVRVGGFNKRFGSSTDIDRDLSWFDLD